ncbi:MAG: serine/threonine phosphatase [Aphanizomenon gracile PMC649.10]|nr:serine/threonine phosphatase [Aphanizomenon gracile PMC638.10]MDM3852553.1 serine/threonine phosphatase [Aphanizomenon gracile PMC627.10]MDM3855931.1 serine/threonine phosphatase [Aphanizomenon gracile PMC649.10]MDM3859545.1 serine/threonine phosphatase [Aphanizomenon gracile PMC644.10]
MLICPQCKFENVDSNKFCQNCGTSLAHKICSECSADMALDAQYCYKCGAESSTVWYAIITQAVDKVVSATAETAKLSQNLENIADNGEYSGLFSKFILDAYLDPWQRYRLLESPQVFADYIEVKVLDCQPYEISLTGAMLLHGTKMDTRTIPALAQAYLKLQVDKHPGIPNIHDAWRQDHVQVVLLENRSNFPTLLDVLRRDTISPVEILHWFYQMTQLWELLETVNCRQSLLELSNLRLDEGQTLVLQRLYIETPLLIPQPPEVLDLTEIPENGQQALTLKSLGRMWQTLFRECQHTPLDCVVQMLEDVESGNIQTLAQLLSHLQEIAEECHQEQLTSSPVLALCNDTKNKSDEAPTLVLSMQLSSVEYAAATDVGRQRDHNEDYFGVDSQVHKIELPGNSQVTAQGLYILCDGMGGHAGGEIASQLAVNTIRQYFQEIWVDTELPAKESIRQAVYLANQAIYELNQKESRSGIGRMGTTLVMLLIQDNQAAIAHVGDSRLYWLTRKQGLEQITIDHEVGQREIARGIEPSIAYGRADAYQLTQALGPRHEDYIRPDVMLFDINEDMLLVLVSDGLSDNDCLETHWQTHLQPLLSSSSNLVTGVQNLIELGNEHNGHDNITAILVRVNVRISQQSCL